jgi:ribosomal protein L37AE/L43A
MPQTESSLAVVEPTAPALRAELTIEELVAQAKKIHAAMDKVMTDGEHYGVIPGTSKPTLYQPGAQKLLLLFRLDPQYVSTPIAPDLGGGDHLAVKSVCTLWHIPSGQRLGSGEGICSTREVKYAYRQARRKCPHCGQEAIMRGKAEYGGGWLCFKKRDGCGAKFKDGDAAIEAQPQGRVPNEDLADCYNTVLKMANKRALVAATLNVTAASDLFTQDLEDETPPTSSANQTAVVDVEAEPGEAQDDPERETILAEIKATADQLGLKAPARAELWTKFCGAADPRTVDIASLSDLAAHLRKMKGK